MDVDFEIDPTEFHEKKRRRISSMTTSAPPPHKVAPVSAPGVHEVATFLPGRLEFEHELDNEAEDIVKDLEFGICLEWGGDQIPEDENDQDVKARAKWAEEMKAAMQAKDTFSGKRPPNGLVNGVVNGYHSNGDTPRRDLSSKPDDKKDDETDDGDEQTQPPPFETQESLAFKLALLESYYQRVEKRHEAKSIMFDRGLLNYKQVSPMSAFLTPMGCLPQRGLDANGGEKAAKGRQGYFAPAAAIRAPTDGGGFRAVSNGYPLYVHPDPGAHNPIPNWRVTHCLPVDEHMLRKRIQDLQHYRRMGLRTSADIEKYDADVIKRASRLLSNRPLNVAADGIKKANVKANMAARDYYSERRLAGGRASSGPDPRRGSMDGDHEREATPKLSAGGASGTGPPARKMRTSTFPCLSLSTIRSMLTSALLSPLLQPPPSTSRTAPRCICSHPKNRRCARRSASCRNRISSSRRRSCASTRGAAASCAAARRAT